MATARHPQLSHVTYEVNADRVSDWEASGWVFDEPESAPVPSFLTLETFEFSDDDES